MIELDVKTGAVLNKRERDPVMVKTPFGVMDQTAGYIRGWLEPRYPVPCTMDHAIELTCRTRGGLQWLVPLKLRELKQRGVFHEDGGL